MLIIEQSHEILSIPKNILRSIEIAGRTCYKSEDRITSSSDEKFVTMLIKAGHHAMLELGGVITVRFITNRGVTHELVRHRLCSFAQESTRYVNYARKQIEFILPVWCDKKCLWMEFSSTIPLFEFDDKTYQWLEAVFESEGQYNELIRLGWRPEQAREVLPNSLKTEIVIQANIREWRHILQLRTAPSAHPQIRSLMIGLLDDLKKRVSAIFDDIHL